MLNFADMDQAAENNPDGFGYAFVKTVGGVPHVIVRKHVEYKKLRDEFHRDYKRYRKSSPFMVHFRWATHGTTNTRNAHPFNMGDGGAAIHNGIIDMHRMPQGDSDTLAFINKVVNRMPSNWRFTQVWVDMVGRMADIGNKLVFLWPDKTHVIIGENEGFWHAGVWYSNSSHKTRRYTNYDNYDASWLDYKAQNVAGMRHAAECMCNQCCLDYDVQHPQDSEAYDRWVQQTFLMRAERIGGVGSTYEFEGISPTSMAPLIINAKGTGTVKTAGKYMHYSGTIYGVPKGLQTAGVAEVFAWFRKKILSNREKQLTPTTLSVVKV